MCLTFLVIGFGLSVGCASPASRIKKNPELFNTFPPDVQDKVKRGQVDVGFTPEMVTMALGTPNHIYTRQTTTEIKEVWTYTGTTYTTDRQHVNADFSYRDSSGSYRNAHDWVWVDVTRETEYDRIRVEFITGKVSAIDILKQ